MRVAFFVNRFPWLSEQFIVNQITGLIDRGHDVEIFAARPGDAVGLHADVVKYRLLERTHYRFQRPGARARRVLEGMAVFATHVGARPSALLRALNVLEHGREAWSLGLLFAATQLLNRPPFDIAHCHFGPAGLFAVRLREIGALTGKLVTTFYGTDVSKYPRIHGPAVYRRLIQDGDLFICITDHMRDQLVANGFPPGRICKIPIGIHLSMFTPRAREVDADGTVRLLTVSRLVDKKGLETSIRAVAELVRSHSKVRYQIIGDGPLRASLEGLIGSLGLQDRVELCGWRTQEQIRDCFEKSHIFVLASQTADDGDEEGMPQVLKEAQAMELPVVSTWHSGIPELVLDGTSGFLVPERDASALADRLRYLIDHPEIWPAMGQAGRRHVETIGNIERLNDQLAGVYGRLLGTLAA
jgi:colanic acid/amylovoran biosynthesis glycosyltransferase